MPGADVQVLVPAKRLAEAKSRLRSCLGDAEREALVLDMLSRVVAAARTAARVAIVSVVTPDLRIARCAKASGACVIADEGHDLNGSLRGALRNPLLAQAAAWLILPADLPFLTAGAVEGLLAQVESVGRMAIAPDQHMTGTNGLAWRGARYDAFQFGPDSFAAHRRAGQAAGFTVAAHPLEPRFFDLDDAEGLTRMAPLSRAPNPRFPEAKAHG